MEIDDYWYENKNLLKEGMVFRTHYNDIVMLDRRVPGDGTDWFVIDRVGEGGEAYWSKEDSAIHPGDLIERIVDLEGV